jgi:isoleucyl-tRNA synthetase
VHLLEWPEIGDNANEHLGKRWAQLRRLRSHASEVVEPLRREKQLGSGMEAELWLLVDSEIHSSLAPEFVQELLISGPVHVLSSGYEGVRAMVPNGLPVQYFAIIETFVVLTRKPGEQQLEHVGSSGLSVGVAVKRTEAAKCGRCWRHLPEVTGDGALCGRCTEVVGG